MMSRAKGVSEGARSTVIARQKRTAVSHTFLGIDEQAN
jgi:hypothetical protein